MADLFDWSTTPGSNTTVDGVNIAENCAAGNLNNGIRAVMALVRNSFATALETFLNGTAPLPVANGGTASTTAADARTALSAAKSGSNSDITSLTGLTTALSIAQGGTSATTAAAALAALGGSSCTFSGTASAGYITILIGSTTFKIQWQDVSLSGSTSQSVNYNSAFSSWSRAWVNLQDVPNGRPINVSSTSASAAVIRNQYGSTNSGQLFSIGV
ncbi:MAG: hypothetical protein KGM99_12515 [Burkholderiales bacterium]|nr:hypothetical protein [Burkholderiales bacterium]